MVIPSTLPHPQSQLSLLSLNQNLRDESLSRARVYRTMFARIQWDRRFVGRLKPCACCPIPRKP
jgi:hypothetical protein